MREYFLQTERIGFSKWSDEDFNLALSLWGDPEVTKLISASGKFSTEEIRERLRKEIENDEWYDVQYWPVFNMKTGEHLGCCGLRPYDLENGVYEIGFHIKSQYWGNKYAFEAATAVLQYSFDHLKASNIFAGHNPNNISSKRLLEKLGFQYSHNEYYPPTGLYHPSYKYF